MISQSILPGNQTLPNGKQPDSEIEFAIAATLIRSMIKKLPLFSIFSKSI